MTNSLLVVLALLSVAAFCQGMKIHFKDCGGTSSVEYVYISPCTKEPCTITRGKSTTFGIGFTTKSPAKSVTMQVAGFVYGSWFPWPVGQSDACKNCGLTCPLGSGQKNSYHVSIPVASWYPPIGKMQGKFELQDENGHDIVCVTMDIVLQ